MTTRHGHDPAGRQASATGDAAAHQTLSVTAATALPVALPPGSPQDVPSSQVRGEHESLRGTNIADATSSAEPSVSSLTPSAAASASSRRAAPAGAPEQPRARQRRRPRQQQPLPSVSTAPPGQTAQTSHGRIGARQRAQLAADLSTRDVDVLARIAEHRYLTSTQVQRFVFTGYASDASATRSSRYALAKLERLGLLRRLDRRVGGVRAGSAATIWQLTPGGIRLLHDQNRGYRTHEPSGRFLNHCLAIADAHLSLNDLTTTPAADTGSDDGREDAHGAAPAVGIGIQKVTVAVEPASWRRFTGPGGEPRWLQPDLATTLTGTDAEGEYTDHWFIEVDCGTESIPTLLRKCDQYAAYHASGVEQDQLGTFPAVLWLFTGPTPEQATHRLNRLEVALRRRHRTTSSDHSEGGTGMHRFATPDTLSAVVTTFSAVTNVSEGGES